MKKAVSLIAAAVCASMVLTGCSFVKVVKIGEEGTLTGEKTFDASAESNEDWGKVAEEIEGKATDLTELLKADGVKGAVAVKTKAEVKEFVSKANGKKTSLVIIPEGYEGKDEISVQTGSIYTGTAVRDVQTLKTFESFTNQTEWSEYAKSLNKEVDENVVLPLDLAKNDPTGKTITLVGCATPGTTGGVVITPVEITIE